MNVGAAVADLLLASGLLSAVLLLPLMLATLACDGFRLWPTPGRGTAASILFWTTFRTLNVTTLALAALSPPGALGLPLVVRAGGLAVFALFLALYAAALLALGRANTYCGRSGLVCGGLYRWSRNPQYATIIPSYAGLALWADSAAVYALAAALVAVYVMMALAEESWLGETYGERYRSYARRVGRFLAVRRAFRIFGRKLGHRRGRPQSAEVRPSRALRSRRSVGPPVSHA